VKTRGLVAAIIYGVLGCAVGLLFNSVRSDGIPLVAESLPTIADSTVSMNPDSLSGIHVINLQQAKFYYDKGIPFIDAREEEEYREGHIVGAFPFLNFMELVFNLDTLQTREDLIITYCSDAECGLSKNLAYDLQASGFTHILVFEGGWNDWVAAGYPVESE